MTWHPAPDGEASSRPLREAIEHYLNRGGHGEVAVLADVVRIWSEVVGASVASHVHPAALLDGVLYLDVDAPAWSTEVTFLADRMLAALAERLGTPVATSVKARVRGGSGVE